MKNLLVLAALPVLVSCAGTTGRTFNELYKGMNKEIAMEKLGKADEITQKGEFEMHTYKGLFGTTSSDGCSQCNTRIVKTDYYVVYKGGQVVKIGSMHANNNH